MWSFYSLISAEDPTFIFLEFYSCNQPLMLVLIDNNNTNMSMMGGWGSGGHYLAEQLKPQLVLVHLSSAASPQHGLFVWVTHGNKACYMGFIGSLLSLRYKNRKCQVVIQNSHLLKWSSFNWIYIISCTFSQNLENSHPHNKTCKKNGTLALFYSSLI